MNLAVEDFQGQPCQDQLVQQVIAPGLCVACGACLGLCPHYLFMDGRVAAPDKCDLAEGRCLELCPVALEQDPAPRRAGLAADLGLEMEPPMGPVLAAWQGRAQAPALKGKAQYGGVVTELLSLALEEDLVSEAVLTTSGKKGAPQGVLAKTRDEVLAAAGSIYAGGGALGELNRALASEDQHALALVGLPCQVLAAAAMKTHPRYEAAKERLGLVIGLFCTMNLPARELRNLLSDEGVEGPVLKSDFPPPPAGIYQVWTEDGYHEVDIEKLRDIRFSGCGLCPDLTAEFTDLSVGACEGRPGLDTILVRSQAGADLVQRALEAGRLELEPADEESMEHLREAAANKRQRAAEAKQE